MVFKDTCTDQPMDESFSMHVPLHRGANSSKAMSSWHGLLQPPPPPQMPVPAQLLFAVALPTKTLTKRTRMEGALRMV